MTPKVSIVVSVFNGEVHIGRTIDELVHQTEKDIEIILVDDGSEDLSLSLLNKYALTDNRIKVVHDRNKGPGAARNKGMDIAKGEYIIFLDIDDSFSEDLIKVMYETAVNTGADITICSALRYDVMYDVLRPFPEALLFQSIPYGKETFTPNDVSTRLFQITGAFAWNKIFKLSFLKDNNLRFAETYCYEDMAMMLPALACAEKIAVTYKELIQYRMETGKSLSDSRAKYYEALMSTLTYILQELESHGKYERFAQSYLNKVLSVLCQVFRSYTDEKAFRELYKFAKDNFCQKLQENDESYYYSSYNFKILCILIESDSPMDFALKIFHIRQKASQDVFLKFWGFPYHLIEKDSNIILFGAGDVGRDVYIEAMQSGWCNIVAWVDSVPDKYVHRGFPVKSRKVLGEHAYDKLLICIRDAETAECVCKELRDSGISEDKILVYSTPEKKDEIVNKLVKK